MNMRWLLLSLVFLGSCADKSITPPVSTPSQKPPVAVSAVDTIDEAMVALRAAEAEAERTRQNLDRTQENLAKANSSLRSTIEQTARLVTQKSATEAELIDLYNRMVAQEKAYTDLTKDFDATKASLLAEKTARTALAAKLTEAERKAATKDAEAAELRRLLDTSERNTAATAAALDRAAKIAADAKAAADSLEGQNKTLWKVCLVEGACILLAVIIFVLLVTRRISLPGLPF